MQLSIIIPVYQVEQYIRACLESVFQQGLPDADFEVLLVDDGTEDNSFLQIADLIDAHANITVLRQPNRGLSAARNTALAEAKGRFVLFLDSDDLLVPFSIVPLLDEAERQHPDMLIAGFVKLNDEEIRHMDANCWQQPSDTLEVTPYRGREFFLGPFNPRECYVWRTLYSRQFLVLSKLRFVEGVYFEDVPFTTQCYLKANLCLYTSRPIYIYRQRPGSICSTVTVPKLLAMNKVLACLWEMRESDGLRFMNTEAFMTPAEEKAVKAQLMNTIFVNFCIETWFITHDKQLMAHRREIIADLRRRIPGLYFSGSVKAWLTSCLFRLMPTTYLWLRSRRNMFIV